MLSLDFSQPLESGLIGISQESEGIPKSEGRLDADLGLETHLKRASCDASRRGEGKGTGNGGKEGDELVHYSNGVKN